LVFSPRNSVHFTQLAILRVVLARRMDLYCLVIRFSLMEMALDRWGADYIGFVRMSLITWCIFLTPLRLTFQFTS